MHPVGHGALGCQPHRPAAGRGPAAVAGPRSRAVGGIAGASRRHARPAAARVRSPGCLSRFQTCPNRSRAMGAWAHGLGTTRRGRPTSCAVRSWASLSPCSIRTRAFCWRTMPRRMGQLPPPPPQRPRPPTQPPSPAAARHLERHRDQHLGRHLERHLDRHLDRHREEPRPGCVARRPAIRHRCGAARPCCRLPPAGTTCPSAAAASRRQGCARRPCPRSR